MLVKTQGIVFRNIHFGESSVILHVFTEDFGLQSYIVHQARKRKTQISPNVLQALHFVELVAYQKASGDLHKIKEIKNSPHHQEIGFDIVKTSVALFLDEVLIKAVRQNQKDTALYQFLTNSLSWLDSSRDGMANFPILFLAKLTRFLGFYPSKSLIFEKFSSSTNIYFDLKNGVFLMEAPPHPDYIENPIASKIYTILELNFEQAQEFKLAKEERSIILNVFLKYYALHTDGFHSFQSLSILNQVFEGDY